MQDITTKQPLAFVPLIKAPQLIKVLTISAKIVDQLPWQHEEHGRFDWTNQELVGRLVEGGILARHSVTGALSRLGDLVFIQASRDYLMQHEGANFGEAVDRTNAALKAVPQVFTT